MKITTTMKTTTKTTAVHPMGQANASPGHRLQFLMFLAAFVVLPIVELDAQFIDFEINPDTGVAWTEGDVVTDQYELSHGIIFSYRIGNVPSGSGAGPRIVQVGMAGPNNTNYAFRTDPDCPSIDQCAGGGVTTNWDQPRYLLGYPPVDPLDDIKCFFLTDNLAGQGMAQDFVLRITYTDTVECFQLSGRLLDTDSHGTWTEGWTAIAYGDDDGNPITPAVEIDSTGHMPPPFVCDTCACTMDNPNGDGSVMPFQIDVTGSGVPIDYVEIVYTGTGPTAWGSIGLGFDNFSPCSLGVDHCDSFDTFQHCFGEEAGFADYVLDFWVDNNTIFDVSKLFIPATVPGNPSTISPNFINYDPPIPAGTPIHVELNIDVPPGGYGPMEIPIGLMSKDLITGDLFECCATSVSFGATEFSDCNSNNIPDECEPDCNNNDIVDECDIISGASNDCNDNGVPDECEDWPDCNNNGIPDECDISSGTSNDCNNNGIPDGCENCSCCNVVMRIGDPNGDGAIDIGDAIAMLGYLFNQVAINCVAAMDVNGDNLVDISDPIYELAYLFNQGAPPVGGGECTPDADPANPPLECEESGCP